MQSVQLAASEIWVTLIFCVIMYLFRSELKEKKVTKILMIVCITRLVSDAISWAFDGVPGLFWGIITRGSNYITFVSNDLVSLVFSVFIWELVRSEDEKPGIVLKAYWILEAIAMGALTLNLYFGWFYSIDSGNGYSRGQYYRMTHIAPIAALFVVLWMLIRYHSKFNRNLKVLGWTYFVLMAGATAYEYMNFGLSLQTYAQTFSALMAFFVGEIEIRQHLIFTQEKLEQKNEELKEEEKKVKAALEAEMKKDEELREQQDQLSLALAAAQQANKAKTMFLNSMSHDIRTPMNAIIGFTALAQTHIDNAQRVQDYLAKINTSSTHLLSLINDILDMSRIESGSVKLDEKPVHMPDLLHDLRTMIQGLINAKQLNLYIDTQDVQHEDVITDKLRLNQILINIVGNAIKFTPVGGDIIIHLVEKPCQTNGYTTYEFSIKDTGIGMSPEFMEHVFDTFSREQSATVSGIQGTGLGMAITKNIVEMMGGTIEVESEEGKGSKFTVTLTVRLADQPIQYQPIPELQGARALVVDDDIDTCRSVCKMLRNIDMQPDWTVTGREAVLRAQDAAELNEEYKVYIIDYLMPDMNGIETIRRIRRVIRDDVPIIVLTAYDWTDFEKEAREAGATAFVAKPIFMSELKSVLTKPIQTNEQETVSTENSYDYTGKRVLLVEDNELNREIASTILGEAGMLIDCAEDGIEAVNIINEAPEDKYDLVLMDIQMPRMDGYTATREIRTLSNNRKANIPIVAMTANAFEEDRRKAFECGMNGHIVKPFDMNAVTKTLGQIFGDCK
ncbi:response regulator [Blautia sp. MSJ-19]|uniref:response regulator n=1 Tax=Blautia sp. MSJ-19 TaxID=2841517 RepID=UPI001C0EE9B2|nr:response regulator [Blautia sp. MSJ-19]MBU5481609.1 response regulator [Blautia sp. MSJ-19]